MKVLSKMCIRPIIYVDIKRIVRISENERLF